MAYRNDEKTLNADIAADLFDLLEKQRRNRGQIKKDAVQAAIKLWVDLPRDIQSSLIDRSLDANSLVILVQEIVDQRIAKGYADGDKFVAKHRKNKRSRKD